MTMQQQYKKDDIIEMGDNVPARIKKLFVDGRGHVPYADYNGYCKVSHVDNDILTLLPLYGRLNGNAWIASPIRYRVENDELILINDTTL